jgi:hypothetical protein
VKQNDSNDSQERIFSLKTEELGNSVKTNLTHKRNCSKMNTISNSGEDE